MSNLRTTDRIVNLPGTQMIREQIDFPVPIAPSAILSIYFYPNTGKIGKNVHIRTDALAPGGSTTGTHYTKLGDGGNVVYTLGSSTFASSVSFNFGYWFAANSTKYPLTGIEQGNSINKIKFSNTYPFTVEYANLTNAIQAVAPFVIIEYEEVNE